MTNASAAAQAGVTGRSRPVRGARATRRDTGIYVDRVLDLGRLDLDEIAQALSDQTDDEHRWLIDPRTGRVAFWTSDTGIDGKNPVDLDELDPIDVPTQCALSILS